MNFRRGRTSDVPEINLPTADASKPEEPPKEINVVLTAAGQVLVNKAPLASASVQSISEALRRAAGDLREPVVVINADAKANYQSVVDIMQAAQAAGYPRISFATQSPH